MLKDKASLTAKWFNGTKAMPIPTERRKGKVDLKVRSASCHNLKDFNVDIPLKTLVAFCGVSGSGKSTLAMNVIANEIRNFLRDNMTSRNLQSHESIKRLILVEQKRGAAHSRSLPATYVGIMTELRQLFAETKLAKARGYSVSHFSLNKRGGRCDNCEGMGDVCVTMPFMPDVYVTCEVCDGKKYNFETLQVTWKDVTMADVLQMTVEEAAGLFENIPNIASRLTLMKDLGLEYLTLGQNFTTLSGGEIQRLKLVAELGKKTHEHTLYILDEPSAGLHLNDIEKLVKILHRLVEKGHSVFVVEHHLEVLKQADWVIELGPKGGPKGGQLVFEGSPEDLKKAHTATGEILN
jgi:excinuclease ABC subunit A